MSVSGKCLRCGTYRDSLNCDHIIPKWMGGTDDESNIQYLCANCHEDKTNAEKRSPEWREKIITPEYRTKISAAGKGRIPTEETRRRQSASLMGRRYSAETIERMRKGQMGNKNCAGRVWTEEMRANMSRAKKLSNAVHRSLEDWT